MMNDGMIRTRIKKGHLPRSDFGFLSAVNRSYRSFRIKRSDLFSSFFIRYSLFVILCFLFIILYSLFIIPTTASAQVVISTSIPVPQPSGGPGGFIDNFYRFSLMIGGILAFGAIVYGGIKYIFAAGNPSGQTEGKEWVKGAIYGLLLLAGSYLILNVINPNLTNLTLPGIKAPALPSGGRGGGIVNIYACVASNGIYACSPGNKADCSDVSASANCRANSCVQVQNSQCGQSSGGGGGVSGLSDANVRSRLAGIQINAACPQTCLNGMRQGTINEIERLKQSCGGGCAVMVTAGTEADSHNSDGACSHVNGYKADVQPNTQIDNYIKSDCASIGGRGGDNAAQYRCSSGAVYAKELSHWDMYIGC